MIWIEKNGLRHGSGEFPHGPREGKDGDVSKPCSLMVNINETLLDGGPSPKNAYEQILIYSHYGSLWSQSLELSQFGDENYGYKIYVIHIYCNCTPPCK